MAVLESAAALSPTDLEYFENAADDFHKAAERTASLLRQESETRTVARDAKASLETRDAAFIRQGLTIDGRPCKNAEEREAAIAALREIDPEYQRARRSLQAAEIRLGDIQADLERVRDDRSLARSRMQYATAMLTYLAGVE